MGEEDTVLFRDVHSYHHFAQKLRVPMRGEWDEVVSEHKFLEWSHGKKDQECYFLNVHNDLVSSNLC